MLNLGTTRRFLKILEKLPAIWDEKHPEFKCKTARANSYIVLVNLVNLPDFDVTVANKRFQYIRVAILKYLRRIQHLAEAEQVAELQKSFYPYAKFLTDMYKVKYNNQFQDIDKILSCSADDTKSTYLKKGRAGAKKKPTFRDEIRGKKLPFNWTLQHSRLLFSIIERYPAIWNEHHPLYADRAYRMDAYKQVAQELGIDGIGAGMLRRKYEHLRDNVFRKIRTKHTTNLTNSYYPAARFLIDSYAEKYPQFILQTSNALIEWDTPHSAKLLSLIEKFPCIWNEDDQHYRAASVRAEAFQSICTSMNLPDYDETMLHKKYESIRGRVRKKFRRYEQGDADERAQVDKELQLGFYPAADFLIRQFRAKTKSNRKTAVERKMGFTTAVGSVGPESEQPTESEAPTISQSTCRICLSPSDGSFKSIVKPADEDTGLSLEQIIQYTTGYIVTTDQPFYPASLCETCGVELARSYEFIKKCEQTEEFLELLYRCQDRQEADQLYESSFVLVEVAKQPNNQNISSDKVVEIEIHAVEHEEVVEAVETDHGYNKFVVKDKEVHTHEKKCEDIEPEMQEHPGTSHNPPAEAFDDKIDEEVEIEGLEKQVTEQLEALKSGSFPIDCQKHENPITTCEFCGKCMHPRQLKDHILRRHSETYTPLPCEFCGKDFKDIKTLRNHVKLKHSNRPQIYNCRFCGQTYSTPSSRRHHERVKHENGRKFPCSVCDLAFLSAKHLQIHIISHTNEMNFECEICSKRFKTKPQLVLHHKGNHTSQRVRCPICQKEFKLDRYCQIHIRSVHGEKSDKKKLAASRKHDVIESDSEEDDVDMDEPELRIKF